MGNRREHLGWKGAALDPIAAGRGPRAPYVWAGAKGRGPLCLTNLSAGRKKGPLVDGGPDLIV